MIWQGEGELTVFHLYFKLSSYTGSKSKLTSAATGGLGQYWALNTSLCYIAQTQQLHFSICLEKYRVDENTSLIKPSLFSVAHHDVPVQDALALIAKALGSRSAECTRVSHKTADLVGDCPAWELWDVQCASGDETYFCYQQENAWIGWNWTQ